MDETCPVEQLRSWGERVDSGFRVVDLCLHEDSSIIFPDELEVLGTSLVTAIEITMERLRPVLETPYRIGPEGHAEFEKMEKERPDGVKYFGGTRAMKQRMVVKFQLMINTLAASLLGEIFVPFLEGFKEHLTRGGGVNTN